MTMSKKSQNGKNSTDFDAPEGFQEVQPIRFLKPDEDLQLDQFCLFVFHSFTTITESTTGEEKNAVNLIIEETGEILTAGSKVLVKSILQANPEEGDQIGILYLGIQKSTANKGQSFHNFRVFLKRK